ncbi:heavy metal translocating P-type ATPase [Anaerovorax odorimutans]|uniref:Cd(2+)-exporting ATPase n=1 Tax=Anaerovorax odorimutans TaxID=109327 RepID=A0ABT1RNR0_9FIRM|nr:heavy metal translocating P-type ATPase [Anaerovorax odorimutans]MCQ4636829.1 heavy metal translocating P-type ATPase [Anaerovorax odorimutans]
MKRKQKIKLARVIVSGVLLVLGALAPLPALASFIILMVSYLVAGYDTLFTAIRNICHGQVFDENFLMAIATVGAIGLKDYKEAVFVMLFYLVGTIFEEYAVNKSRGSISELMDIRPDYANLIRDGREEKVDPYEVSIGDTILVKPGERVPLDGRILEGHSALDTSALTGESLPRDVSAGEDITSGCINMTGVLKIKVSSEFDDSTVAKILDMVENAGSKKAKVEKFITKFARYYTPIVVIAAALMAVVPPLAIPGQSFGDWISRALIFLVISCPCALVISVPLAFFGGVGGASRCGVLVKGSNYLEALAKVDTVIFDKTGTLTTGTFTVTDIYSADLDDQQLLELAAYAESYSDHPISLSIKEAFGKEIDKTRVSETEELSGKGIKAVIDGKLIYAGNKKLMADLGIEKLPVNESATLVHLAEGEKYLGYVAIADTVKEDSASAIRGLKAAGVHSSVMLTGDRDAVAGKVASTIGLDAYYAELLPGDKVELAEKIIAEKQAKGNVVFVGDGINDAPVLARADIGVAMGGLGSEAAIEAADIVIMDDQPSKLSTVIKIARKTLSIARQNVVFALTVKAVVLVLGALGMASMWAAVFADVGVAVIAILNSMRALGVKKL